MRDRSDRELGQLFQLDGGAGPARPVDAARSAALIAGALTGAGFPPPIPGGGGAGGATKAAATKTVAAGSAKVGGVKLVVLAGGAMAVALASWVGLRSPSEPPIAKPPVAAVVVAAPVAPAPVPPPPAPPAEPVSEEPVPSYLVDDDTPPSGGPLRTTSSTERRPVRAPPSKPRSKAHGPRAAPAQAATADLLAAANAARAEHRWRDADALYTRVVSAAPDELAQQAALVASASLHLEHLGDPAGAIRRFRAALAAGPRDALAEDARWGLAEAARKAGDAAAETSALDDFLAHHAGSPRAARARVRRAELEAGR